MITAVDTNILLDILIPDAPAMETSQRLLDAVLQQGGLVISEIVYAELAAHLPTPEELEHFLDETGIWLMPSRPPVLSRAEPGRPGSVTSDGAVEGSCALHAVAPSDSRAGTAGLLCEGDSISSAISSWGPMPRSRRISS
jgi:hypothetical protein